MGFLPRSNASFFSRVGERRGCGECGRFGWTSWSGYFKYRSSLLRLHRCRLRYTLWRIIRCKFWDGSYRGRYETTVLWGYFSFSFLSIFLSPFGLTINAFSFVSIRLAFLRANPVRAANYFWKHTRVSRVFSLWVPVSSVCFHFCHTGFFFFFFFTLSILFHSFPETSSFGGGMHQNYFFSFFSTNFSFVSLRFLSFRLKIPRRAFGGGRFSLATRWLRRTANTFDIYIYILFFFLYLFIERAECCSARGRHTRRVFLYFCLTRVFFWVAPAKRRAWTAPHLVDFCD